MALFSTSLRFASDFPNQPARKWSNVIFVEAPSAVTAASLVLDGWEQLRDGCRDRVYAYEVYATDTNPATDNYFVLPIDPGGQRGTRPSSGLGEPYLPKACVAVTLTVTNSRPSRKFFRPGLLEGDVISGVSVEPNTAAAIVAAWNGFLSAGGDAFRDPDGQIINAVGRIRLTTREFGREATADVPQPPALG